MERRDGNRNMSGVIALGDPIVPYVPATADGRKLFPFGGFPFREGAPSGYEPKYHSLINLDYDFGTQVSTKQLEDTVKKMQELSAMIERLPASPQQTELSVCASNLRQQIDGLKYSKLFIVGT